MDSHRSHLCRETGDYSQRAGVATTATHPVSRHFVRLRHNGPHQSPIGIKVRAGNADVHPWLISSPRESSVPGPCPSVNRQGYRVRRHQTRWARGLGVPVTDLHARRGAAVQSIYWLETNPLTGIRHADLTQTKHRPTSNGLRSRIMYQAARASLCASAFIATTGSRWAFLRS